MPRSYATKRLQKELLALLIANALMLAALAFLPVVTQIDLYTGGPLESLHFQPRLHTYCRDHVCPIEPALVSTSYALQGIYALVLTITGSVFAVGFTEFAGLRTRVKGTIALLIGTVIFLFDDANGIASGGIYSNYVHRNPAYIFHPTFIFFCITSIAIGFMWVRWNFATLTKLKTLQARND